ncbi:SAM-dependent methyltransferase [Parafrankia irregularis]|uniref:SAM-dependent methyltransferase n=1 Tax=Parafrankia irregularis TaxID=795642 RepID=UPI000B893662|nr:SAM-dependent methyltransferase [Parafrankia irregularis]
MTQGEAVRVTWWPSCWSWWTLLVGGKDNFPADRQAAEQALAVFPHARVSARQNRAFLHRVTRFLTRDAGVRQFLDIGTGIPTPPNLHEVAQSIAPDSRAVYADNDPIVLAHARALLTSAGGGRTAYLDADLREPEKILESAELRDTLDLTRPVALSVIALLHFIPDSDNPYGIIRRYLDSLPAGSYLALTHVTPDFAPDDVRRAVDVYREQGIPAAARTRSEVERFFNGLDPVKPGVQSVHRWRPDDTSRDDLTDAQVNVYGGLARIP